MHLNKSEFCQESCVVAAFVEKTQLPSHVVQPWKYLASLLLFHEKLSNCTLPGAIADMPECILCLMFEIQVSCIHLLCPAIPSLQRVGLRVGEMLPPSYSEVIGITFLPLLISGCKNPPPPMLHDACMFRFMIMFALCFVMGTAHRLGTFQKCQGWIWQPPGLMPLHFGNAPSLRLYCTITLPIFNRCPGQDLDFNWNHRTNLQKYLQAHWDILHTNHISIIPYRSTWNNHFWRSQRQKHQTDVSLCYRNL